MSKKNVIRVQDVMQTQFDMVDGIMTIAEALGAAKHLENECLVVNRRDEDDEYGILLLADIARQVLAADKSPHRVNVYEVMNKPVIAVKPSMDIRYCSRLFNRFNLAVAPVSQDHEIIGLVSYKNIVLNGVLKSFS